MSKKRRREADTVNTRLVEIYEDLANEDNNVQVKAAEALLSHLSPSQQPTMDHIEKAVRRLFRGLCSGRRAARVGFSIALTELLAQVVGDEGGEDGHKLPLEQVFEILESSTRPSGNISGQDERDHYFGRVFGSEALIKSGVLFRSSSAVESWARVVKLIFELAVKKPWIREECGWIVCSAIDTLPSKVVESVYAEEVVEQLNSSKLAHTPEGVAIWLGAMRRFPSMKLPRKVWHREDPLNSREKQVLAKVLKEASTTDQDSTSAENVPEKGNWTPRLNWAWTAVLQELYKSDDQPGWSHKNEKSKRISFVEFWNVVVDGSLFAPSSSVERKYWGFQLFIQLLKEAPPHLLIPAFSQNMLRCLVNQLVQEERFLHRAAERTLKAIEVKVDSDPEFAITAISGLLGPHGDINFDKLTKTTTIEKLLAKSDLEVLDAVAEVFLALITNMVGDEKVVATKRRIMADYLASALRSRLSQATTPDSTAFLAFAMKVFALLGHFGFFIDPSLQPPVPASTQEMFRSRFTSCLNGLTVSHPGFIYNAVDMIHRRREGDEAHNFYIDLDDTSAEALDRAWKILAKINKKKPSSNTAQNASLRAFRLLYSLSILQVYNGDPDALALLDEIEGCYKLLRKRTLSKSTDDNEASETLIEILLSFVSKPSKLFARMSEQVFETFLDRMTAGSLQLLLNVLGTKENLAGQQELFDAQEEGEEDGEDEVEDDEEDEQLGSDVEMDDAKEDDVDTDSDLGSEAEVDEDEITAFEAKLAAALGTHRGEDDLNASDDHSSSDEDMDDEQMEELDGKLVEIFRLRQAPSNKKKVNKEAREMMVTFKGRVLQLLETFTKHQHSNKLVLSLVIPLLRLIRTTNTKHIADKACQIIVDLGKQTKGKALIQIEDEDTETAWTLLKDIHKEAYLGGSNAFGSACSIASLLLAKTLIGYRKEAVAEIVDIYAETRKRQLQDKKCQVQPTFFTDWNNWCASVNQRLRA